MQLSTKYYGIQMKNKPSIILIDFHGATAREALERLGAVEGRVDVLDFSLPEFLPILNLFAVKNSEDIGMMASDCLDGMRMWFQSATGMRLEHILMHGIAGLMELKENLATLSVLISFLPEGKKLQQKIIHITKNPEIKQFWANEFGTYSKDALLPIRNKISSLLMSERIRKIFSFKDNSFDFELTMDNGRILIINLSVGRLGVEVSALLGNLVLSTIQKIGLRRESKSPEELNPCYVFVDECHRLKNLNILHSIINEARKYKINLTISHQETGQVDIPDFKAFTSVSNILVFKSNLEDARRMSKIFNEKVSADNIMNLDVGEVYARINNHVTSFKTFAPCRADPEVAKRIYERSIEKYYAPVKDVVTKECRNEVRKKRVFDVF